MQINIGRPVTPFGRMKRAEGVPGIWTLERTLGMSHGPSEGPGFTPPTPENPPEVDLGAAQVGDRDGDLRPPEALGDLEAILRDLAPTDAVTSAFPLGPEVLQVAIGVWLGREACMTGMHACDGVRMAWDCN